MPRTLRRWTVALVTALAVVAGPAAAANAKPELTASQSSDLTAGTEITVTGTGFTPKTALFLAVCDTKQPPGKACDTGNFARATTDGDGKLEVKIKPVATFGATDCTATTCALMTNDPANPRDTHNFAQLAITFAAAPASPGSPAAQQPAASPVVAPAAADDGGSNTLPLIGVGIVVVLLVVVAIVLVRRRRTA
ncbi:neocarzinostatin apoprotein domain-containing protein [Nonomuraea sediminis]|uniref:neocarzinostatin apoprotein domain-containing protein n=1 Tax=Nonomuraea sediminis TaxID=2835864 RepID=UPI001BDD3F1D|nr:neocarzinostatin apoprotein domain-containing protein [Nonomuraea sediminis]